MFLRRVLFALFVLGALGPRPAHASFHLMQIEQVIGGVGGDVTAQAIQLRMRSSLQNQVQQARLIVRDAAGLNPVTLIDITTPVSNSAAGSRVLVASPGFQNYLSPVVTPDFVMTNLIPASYLAAGTLTFEQDPPTSTILWRLSWGGAAFVGSGTGSVTNDADGNFNPPFVGPLPSLGTQTLQFRFAASALSTNNLNDYQLTAGAAVFTNNLVRSGTVAPSGCSVFPGIDLFTTPAGGATYQDLSATPLPLDFFAPNSDPFAGTIVFTGQPLDPSPSSPLGPSDTIVRRLTQALLPAPGSSTTVPIEIVALSLVSVNPITVTYGGGTMPEQWDVRACLSSTRPQQTGGMTVKASGCGCTEGGTFTSTLPVLARLIFTRTLPTPRQVELDFGTAGLPPLQFNTVNGHWLPADPGLNLTVAPSGLTVDHDCNAGTPAAGPLPGSSNFFAGVRASRCDSGSCAGPLSFMKRMTQEQAALAAHGVLPAQRCLAGDTDGDGICDDADNCRLSANARQADADDDGVGDNCDNCGLRFNPCQADTNHNGKGDVCETLGVGDGLLASHPSLSVPAPNPATNAVSFAVTLPRAARVRVRVLDVRGRLVREFLDQTLAAGRHGFTWNAASERGGRLPSGTYYLRLDADGTRATRSFVFIR